MVTQTRERVKHNIRLGQGGTDVSLWHRIIMERLNIQNTMFCVGIWGLPYVFSNQWYILYTK